MALGGRCGRTFPSPLANISVAAGEYFRRRWRIFPSPLANISVATGEFSSGEITFHHCARGRGGIGGSRNDASDRRLTRPPILARSRIRSAIQRSLCVGCPSNHSRDETIDTGIDCEGVF